MDTLPFSGLKILILEDEFLIAMDVEQLCRDQGAAEVIISRTLTELETGAVATGGFDAAVVDMRLDGTSTLEFAQELFSRRIPFVFATGYANPAETAQMFPGVPVVTKPYLSDDLLGALRGVIDRSRRQVAAPSLDDVPPGDGRS